MSVEFIAVFALLWLGAAPLLMAFRWLGRPSGIERVRPQTARTRRADYKARQRRRDFNRSLLNRRAS